MSDKGVVLEQRTVDLAAKALDGLGSEAHIPQTRVNAAMAATALRKDLAHAEQPTWVCGGEGQCYGCPVCEPENYNPDGTPRKPQEERPAPGKPLLSLTQDGDQWCALLGPNLQEGQAGFGDTRFFAVEALAVALWERAEQATPAEPAPAEQWYLHRGVCPAHVLAEVVFRPDRTPLLRAYCGAQQYAHQCRRAPDSSVIERCAGCLAETTKHALAASKVAPAEPAGGAEPGGQTRSMTACAACGILRAAEDLTPLPSGLTCADCMIQAAGDELAEAESPVAENAPGWCSNCGDSLEGYNHGTEKAPLCIKCAADFAWGAEAPPPEKTCEPCTRGECLHAGSREHPACPSLRPRPAPPAAEGECPVAKKSCGTCVKDHPCKSFAECHASGTWMVHWNSESAHPAFDPKTAPRVLGPRRQWRGRPNYIEPKPAHPAAAGEGECPHYQNSRFCGLLGLCGCHEVRDLLPHGSNMRSTCPLRDLAADRARLERECAEWRADRVGLLDQIGELRKCAERADAMTGEETRKTVVAEERAEQAEAALLKLAENILLPRCALKTGDLLQLAGQSESLVVVEAKFVGPSRADDHEKSLNANWRCTAKGQDGKLRHLTDTDLTAATLVWRAEEAIEARAQAAEEVLKGCPRLPEWVDRGAAAGALRFCAGETRSWRLAHDGGALAEGVPEALALVEVVAVAIERAPVAPPAPVPGRAYPPPGTEARQHESPPDPSPESGGCPHLKSDGFCTHFDTCHACPVPCVYRFEHEAECRVDCPIRAFAASEAELRERAEQAEARAAELEDEIASVRSIIGCDEGTETDETASALVDDLASANAAREAAEQKVKRCFRLPVVNQDVPDPQTASRNYYATALRNAALWAEEHHHFSGPPLRELADAIERGTEGEGVWVPVAPEQRARLLRDLPEAASYLEHITRPDGADFLRLLREWLEPEPGKPEGGTHV